MASFVRTKLVSKLRLDVWIAEWDTRASDDPIWAARTLGHSSDGGGMLAFNAVCQLTGIVRSSSLLWTQPPMN